MKTFSHGPEYFYSISSLPTCIISRFCPCSRTSRHKASTNQLPEGSVLYDILSSSINCMYLVAYLSSYHKKAIKVLWGAHLGIARHRSTPPRWGNPHNREAVYINFPVIGLTRLETHPLSTAPKADTRRFVFIFLAGQIGQWHNVAIGSPPMRRFFRAALPMC